jgi:hypothetical protein
VKMRTTRSMTDEEVEQERYLKALYHAAKHIAPEPADELKNDDLDPMLITLKEILFTLQEIRDKGVFKRK